MSNKSSDFKVQDRRKFTQEGILRDDLSETPAQENQPKEVPPPEKEVPPPESEEQKESDKAINNQSGSPPKMDFPTLILSLTSSAIFQMGLAPNPATSKVEKNILAARQTIDILEILEEKTKGNLDSEESKLLSHCLYDLRMNYVKASQNIIL